MAHLWGEPPHLLWAPKFLLHLNALIVLCFLWVSFWSNCFMYPKKLFSASLICWSVLSLFITGCWFEAWPPELAELFWILLARSTDNILVINRLLGIRMIITIVIVWGKSFIIVYHIVPIWVTLLLGINKLIIIFFTVFPEFGRWEPTRW